MSGRNLPKSDTNPNGEGYGAQSQVGIGAGRKFVLRVFNQQNIVDHGKAVDLWLKLQAAISKIQRGESSSLKFEELYRYAYQLVLNKHGELLYGGVTECIRLHLESLVEELEKEPDETLLYKLRSIWESHCREMSLIRDILMYMDKNYVPVVRQPLIFDKGMFMFRDIVIRRPELQPRIQRLCLEIVASYRAKQPFDTMLFTDTLNMFERLGCGSLSVYKAEFEDALLASTVEYYTSLSARSRAEYSVGEYLGWANSALAFEHRNCVMLLPDSTLPKLTEVLEKTLIVDHALSLVEDPFSGLEVLLHGIGGFVYTKPILEETAMTLLRTTQVSNTGFNLTLNDLIPYGTVTDPNAENSLHLMYVLFSQCEKHKITYAPSPEPPSSTAGRQLQPATRTVSPMGYLAQRWKDFLLQQGKGIISDPVLQKYPSVSMRYFIALQDTYNTMVERVFQGNEEFDRNLRNVFEALVNVQMDGWASEALTLYLDELFRFGFMTMTDAAVETCLNQCIAIFKYIINKDEFEERYKTRLQKRLLSGKVSSDELEKRMIVKLRSECGIQFTTKLEGMFNDLQYSTELMAQYRRDLATGVVDIPGLLIALHTREAEKAAAKQADSGGSATAALPSSNEGYDPLISAYLDGEAGTCDLDVTVLTLSNWPAPTCAPIQLPIDIRIGAEAFRSYYLSRNPSTRFVWNTEKGTASVMYNHFLVPGAIGNAAQFQKYELIVSTYQLAALLQFNDPSVTSLTFETILSALGSPAHTAELTRHLISLFVPRLRLLTKSGSSGYGLEASDVLSLNPTFDYKHYRVKVPLVSMRSLGGVLVGKDAMLANADGGVCEEEEDDLDVHIVNQRRTMLDAVIVRLLKSKKEIMHADLVSSVISEVQHRFVPTETDIANRIEDLIERDFLERDKNNEKKYHYIL